MSGEVDLLELAAKAAGIEHEGAAGSWLAGTGNPALLISGTETVWNPLKDDSDALRLAVMLKLDVINSSAFGLTWVHNEARGIHEVVRHNGDPYAATRGAIVRAAAAMGRRLS